MDQNYNYIIIIDFILYYFQIFDDDPWIKLIADKLKGKEMNHQMKRKQI